LIGAARRVVPLDLLACHFHDTSGTALANVLAALNEGVTVFDSSAGGLGGCPFAPGAAGNLATEDLCYLLDGMGVQTGVSLPALVSASTLLQAATARAPASRVFRRIVGASTPEAT
jgi:hydroxymethylglutaryl-CoA lyase